MFTVTPTPGLTLPEIKAIQAEALADDVPLRDEMRSWTRLEAVRFFESGGAEEPHRRLEPLPQLPQKTSPAAAPSIRSEYRPRPKVLDAEKIEKIFRRLQRLATGAGAPLGSLEVEADLPGYAAARSGRLAIRVVGTADGVEAAHGELPLDA